MHISENWRELDFSKIIKLYNLVGWEAYTSDVNSLKKAFENSTCVLVALDDSGRVLGLARSISDDTAIHYLQNILVDPDFQRNGVGRKLLNAALGRFKHVRTHMILTDDEEKQVRFYESLGYKNTKDLKEIPLNAFVKMSGVELS